MKLLNIVALLALVCLPACGDNANAAGNIVDNVKNAAVVKDLTGTFKDLGSTLGGITDGTTAEAAKEKLSGLVDGLKGQLDKLGGISKLTDTLGGLKDGVMEKIKGLMGNADVTKAIGPILEKLKGLLG